MTTIVPDLLRPDRFAVHSHDAVFLSQIPDLLCRALSQPGDLMSMHSLHSSEQDGARENAYLQERQVLGPPQRLAHLEIVELPRPRQRNVVWIDRYHLVAQGANPICGGMLLGLYASGEGTIQIYVHHPSSSLAVGMLLQQLPHGGPHAHWDDATISAQCRYVIRCSQQERGVIQIACTPLLVGQAMDAIRGHSNI